MSPKHSSPVTDSAAALIEAGDDLYSAFSGCAETKFQIEAMTNYANASNSYRLNAPAQSTLERLPVEKLAKHFRVSVEQAQAAQDDIGFMYREAVTPGNSGGQVMESSMDDMRDPEVASAMRAEQALNDLRAERVVLVKALQQIADLVDSEAGEPLDDAIAIANTALRLVGGVQGD